MLLDTRPLRYRWDFASDGVGHEGGGGTLPTPPCGGRREPTGRPPWYSQFPPPPTPSFGRQRLRANLTLLQDLTEKLDIYSMGMIFWSMLGRNEPFARDDFYKNKVLAGERPFVNPSWHRGFVEVGTF